ncbi:MAG: hypothetical protein ABIQ18_16510 [Umezawaea sp.]
MPQRRRYATRDELAELLVPYLGAIEERHPDGEWKHVDYARALLDALGEMGAPVGALVQVTVDEPNPADVFRTIKVE